MNYFRYSKLVYDEELFTYHVEPQTLAVPGNIDNPELYLLDTVNSYNTEYAIAVSALGDDFGNKALFFVSEEDKEFNAKI